MFLEEQKNNSDLIKRAKTDPLAFEELYNMFFAQLYGYVFKRVSHKETAEDIISIAFTKVFTGIDSYQGDLKTFKAWLYKITTNTIIDHYRKRGTKYEIPIEKVENTLAGPDSTARETELLLTREQLDRSLQKLSKKDQEIIHLKYFAQWTNQEIADQLNITVNNCGVRIYRALAKLKSAHSSYEV